MTPTELFTLGLATGLGSIAGAYLAVLTAHSAIVETIDAQRAQADALERIADAMEARK